MKAHTTVTIAYSPWLRRGIAILGLLLVVGAIAFFIASSPATSAPPAPARGANSEMAAPRARFYAFKQQHDRIEAQAGTSTTIPATSAHERFDEFKQQQYDQIEARSNNALGLASPAARARFYAFKQQQHDQIENGSR